MLERLNTRPRPGLPGPATRRAAAVVLLLAAGPASALCGGPLDQNNFRRPIDVNDPLESGKVNLVVKHHFTPEVAALIKGSTAELPGDIHYTLRHIPNHYEALDAMARFQLRKPGLSERYWTVDCYFERAFAFRPKDARLHLLYGTYLHRAKRLPQAQTEYGRAEELGLRSSELDYNLGLLYFELGERGKSAEYAQRAYAAGYPLPALREKLRKAGYTIDTAAAASKP
jgi:tetratricopeptide (TPR) repeat protein